jgi:hypothetical protein
MNMLGAPKYTVNKFTGVLHYSSTCGGVASSATELTTVLANLWGIVASLVPVQEQL